jgi:hypothetical protein
MKNYVTNPIRAIALCAMASVAFAAEMAPGAQTWSPSVHGVSAILTEDRLLRDSFFSVLNSKDAAVLPALPASLLAAPADYPQMPPTYKQVNEHAANQLFRLLLAYPDAIPSAPQLLDVGRVSSDKIKALKALAEKIRSGPETDDMVRHLAALQSEIDQVRNEVDPTQMRATLNAAIENMTAQLSDFRAPQEDVELHQRLKAAREGLEGVVRENDRTIIRSILDRRFDAARAQFLAAHRESVRAVPPIVPETTRTSAPAATEPPLDKAALQAYLVGKMEVDANIPPEHGVEGIKEASFLPGDYRPEYAPLLREMGVDVAYIPVTTPEDLKKYTEADGYFLTTPQYRSVWKTRRVREVLNGFEPKKRSDLSEELQASAAIPMKIARLVREEWNRFFPLYKREMESKPAGVAFAPVDLVERLDAKNRRLWSVYFDDPETGELLGGMNYGEWPERDMLWGHYAAYQPSAKKGAKNLGIRGFIEGMNLALWLGYNTFSWGLDGVLRGFYRPFSLSLQKINLGASFYPEGAVRFVKILNTEKFGLQRRNTGNGRSVRDGLVLFGIPRGGELERRIVESMSDGLMPPPVQNLLGGDYFTPEILSAGKALVMHHFVTPESEDLPLPAKMTPAIKRPLDSIPQ